MFLFCFGQSGADDLEDEKWEQDPMNGKEVWITAENPSVYSIKQLHFSQVKYKSILVS